MEFLNDMALFVEVVKAKSFRGAADIIGMPNSTLSRRISMLEKAIGLRLLHRTTRKIELTEAGQIYYERCKRIVNEAKLAHEQLGEMLAQPSGVLRASLPVDFAVTYMAPLITEFAKLYPSIVFDFDLTSRWVDLVSEPFDVAIRMGEPENSQLIARPLAALPAYLYASPRYLDRSGDPVKPADLAHHECLSIMKANTWTLHDGVNTTKISINSRFKLNSIGMICRLATLDMGIIMMLEKIVADDLANGRLQRVLPQWHGTPVSVYAVTETRLLPAKTQHFIKFLRERLGKV
ncbi:MAG: LysR family transcriptional regulator [Burkholderiales bacterium]|jgi:DNA-binding transcriptional LysR family regulator|nr:LysR family transcriptional regulator [Nitrosomonas sp.]MCB1976432.1 LysR family transcriptional regulator [Nitrosomonas sp.]MCP5276665.1 LysR family transcriptional regulator [Burkholderiales bacterium]MDR4515793.1 LysR family transcriptional regulator [Nitrosomonas sp.]